MILTPDSNKSKLCQSNGSNMWQLQEEKPNCRLESASTATGAGTVMSTHLPHDYALYITEQLQTLFLSKRSPKGAATQRKRKRKLGGMYDEQEVSWIICYWKCKSSTESG